MTVFSTVGFGDIAAKSETARVVLIVQMLADLPDYECCWGLCSAAGNDDRIQAMTPARPPHDGLPAPQASHQPAWA